MGVSEQHQTWLIIHSLISIQYTTYKFKDKEMTMVKFRAECERWRRLKLKSWGLAPPLVSGWRRRQIYFSTAPEMFSTDTDVILYYIQATTINSINSINTINSINYDENVDINDIVKNNKSSQR